MTIFGFLKSPEKRLRCRINKMYKSDLRATLKDCDSELLAGLLAYGSIASMYKKLKNDLAKPLADKYNVSLSRYFEIVEESLEINMNKYIKNWREMKNTTPQTLENIPDFDFS